MFKGSLFSGLRLIGNRVAVFLVLVGFIPAALAQGAFPTKSITIVVPWAVAGAADYLAREVAKELSDRLKVPVLVENRPGASTNIGTDFVAKATADGHTLLMASSANCVNVTLYKELGLRYDFVRDFVPITNVAVAPNVLVVHPSVPAGNVQELVALAKSKPGQLNYGSAGNGAASHLGAEMFKKMAGIDVVGVQYKGAGPAVVDLAGDRLTFMFTVLPAVKSLVQGGRLKLIAQATPSRLPQFPDLPTVAESGVPGFESSIWYGLVAPAGTPRSVVEKLHAELTAIIKSPRMHSRMVANGTYPIADTQAEFARTITSDIAKYAEVIRAAGIKAD